MAHNLQINKALSTGVLLITLVLGIGSDQALAQKQLSIEEAVSGLYTNLRVENIDQLQWRGSLNEFSFVEKTEDGSVLMSARPGKDAVKVLDLSALNETLQSLKSKEFSPLKSFPRIKWTNASSFYFQTQGTVFTYDLKSDQMSEIGSSPAGGQNKDLYKNGDRIAFTKGNSLYLSLNGKERLIAEGTDGLVYGQGAHRFEFGISKGTFWSPSGRYLAFYQIDEKEVTEYPLVDVVSGYPATHKPIRYPMAGQKSQKVKIGIYDTKRNRTKYLETAEGDDYLTNISWSPDEESIYIAELNRGQDHMNLTRYSRKSGEKKQTLFEERDDKWVEPESGLHFLPNGKSFLWLSERDGWNHLYHYDLDGKLLKQLTNGEWIVKRVLGFSKKGDKVFVMGVKDDMRTEHGFAIDLKRGSTQRIGNSAGVHSSRFSADGRYAIDVYSSSSTPRNISIVDTRRGRVVDELLNAKNPLAEYNMPEVKSLEFKSADGVQLYAKLILPPNLDQNKKYPVIIYTYGGPHLQLVRDRFPASGNLWFDYMAQRDYIVFVMDNRGSANRGLKFEQAVFEKLGQIEMSDQLRGVEYLKSLPYVDGTRIGIHGWSFGGFMTTTLMTQSPGIFKVGVAGGPVIDWRMYEVMYTERYMNTPQENERGYETSDLTNYAKDLDGRLMIIHGAQDDVVVWQHSLKFVRQCVEDGVLLDYFVYPSHPHNVRGKDRVHLMRKVSQYFDDFL